VRFIGARSEAGGEGHAEEVVDAGDDGDSIPF
jgi:hypothetical protein